METSPPFADHFPVSMGWNRYGWMPVSAFEVWPLVEHSVLVGPIGLCWIDWVTTRGSRMKNVCEDLMQVLLVPGGSFRRPRKRVPWTRLGSSVLICERIFPLALLGVFHGPHSQAIPRT